MAFIEVSGISKSFTAATGTVRPVLRDVSLSVERGEFASIVGAMGSGKSTLLSILAGLTSADSGSVMVGGTTVRGVRSDAAFVFQNYSLLPWFTALENVRLAVAGGIPRPRAPGPRWLKPGAPSSRWAWGTRSTAAPVNCRAECASGWPSRAPSPPTLKCCFSTNRSARSMR